MADDWPLVGRVEELALLEQVRRRAHPGSVVVAGVAGIGKSRLVAEASRRAVKVGWQVVHIRASVGMGQVALGPFRAVLRLPAANSESQLMTAVLDALRSLGAAGKLLITVDDGQDLDDTSAALLHQLVASSVAATLMTVRQPASVAPAVTRLWKDGLAERLELFELSRLEVRALLEVALGPNVEDSTSDRLWQTTGGNPLYLREVVHASREHGSLSDITGEWRWRGEWAHSGRLREILADRLGSLAPDELGALEALALAHSLPWNVLADVASAGAIEALERRKLVVVEEAGRRLDVTIAHPLHAEVLASAMPVLQQRSLRRNLADAILRTGARRASDRVRLACWSLDAGLEVDPVSLVAGADAALWQVGRALAEGLEETLLPSPRATEALAHARRNPSVTGDATLAIRLARAAYDAGVGIAAGASLVSALAWTGDLVGAEAVLGQLGQSTTDGDDALRVAMALADVRFWGQQRVEDARAALVEAIASAPKSSDPALLGEMWQKLSGIEVNTGHPAVALEYAETAAIHFGHELARTNAAQPAAASLGFLGRTSEAIEFIDLAMTTAASDSARPMAAAQLLFSRAGALLRAGRLEESRQLAEDCRQAALGIDSLDGAAVFGVVAGEVLLRQGRAPSAALLLRDAVGLLAERDAFGFRPWALSGLAHARAMFGDDAGASRVLAEAEQARTIPRYFDTSLYLARSAVRHLVGDVVGAVSALRDGAVWASTAQMPVDEALLVHARMMIDPAPELSRRLEELAEIADGALVAALAGHATAVASRTPGRVLAAAADFASLSMWWTASEAAAEASLDLDRKHQPRAARAATHQALDWASRCEGVYGPLVRLLSAPALLSKREAEVSRLAVAGYTSKEIAQRMTLSIRTVESHLYRSYTKLGVTDRRGLADALGSRP